MIEDIEAKLAFLDRLAGHFEAVAADIRVIREDLARVGGGHA